MAFEDFESSETGSNKFELFLFETPDGLYKWGYTTDKNEFNIGLFTYEPEVVHRSEIRQSVAEGPSKVTITLPYDSPVCAIHVPYLSPNPIKVTIYEGQRDDPDGQLVQAFTGYITNFNQVFDEGHLECSTILDNVKQLVPWATYKTGSCSWALYGIGCYVNKLDFELVVTDIAVVAGDIIEAGSIATKGDGWFTNGYAVHPETGESRFIIRNDGGRVYFNYPFRTVEPGDTLKLYAGCDRLRSTCKTKFGNVSRYMGFDWFPQKNVFQTGVS